MFKTASQVEYLVFVMDFSLSHLAQYERRFGHPMQIRSIGRAMPKRNWVRNTFDTVNFSFILQGGGEYRTGDKSHWIQAPCVITQWPGIHVEYGPAGQWDYWNELFLIYGPKIRSHCLKTGLATPDCPFWPIHDLEQVERQIAELLTFDTAHFSPGMADRIDRICERMIVESRIGEPTCSDCHQERSIRQIRDYVDRHAKNCPDFAELAARHGMSFPAFRTHWRKYVNMPPARYAMLARLREAKRLLVESDMPIGEIAAAAGFNDPMYFSRKFHEDAGMTASDYRRRNQQPLRRREFPEE